jgi:enterobactin synthetase component D
MPLRTDNPAVFPPAAEQFSLSMDWERTAVEGTPLQDVTIPAELNGATPARRLQFAAGRVCATEALRRLDPRRARATVGRSTRGVPVWPTGVVGSITHTEGFVSAAVARAEQARGLGIDSERIVSSRQAQNVSTHVSWPSELAHARHAGFDRLQAMTLVFSAKETIFKCLYPLIGAMFYYHDVRIVGIETATRVFRARLVKTLSPEFPADTILEGRFDLSELRVNTGMWLAAC